MVFGVTGGCLGFLALKDVFIKIENKRLINKAEELKAMNLEEIVEIYEELDKPGETARVRKLKADLTSPKTEIHGGDDKFSRLKELTEMKEKGLIDDDEFKQMKNEILGK